jgi:pilus assembly protein CpaC
MPEIIKSKVVSVTKFVTMVLVIAMMSPMGLQASNLTPVESQSLQLVSGKSIVLHSDTSVTRISIANPDVADFKLLSPNEIYITAKAAGTTNLTMWRNNRVSAIFDLDVVYDISRFKQQLEQILPDENNLRVNFSNDSITLSGKVSNAANLSQALSLAKAFAPEGNIQNLIQVGGVHQVMLEIRVAEMSKSLTKRLGINLAYTRGDDFAVSTLGGLSQVVKATDAVLGSDGVGFAYSPAVSALFRFGVGSATWTGFLDALREDGLVKILAEPTLITLSGQTANFLAGGEFPVPVPQGLGTVAIEYKPFGVGLVFTPTVLSKNKINLQVSPEVSELDFTNALVLQGYTIPGIRTRRTSTTIELGDGQSFAIAGLLRESVRTINSKYPLLGDIPILGALFQSKEFQKEESELIIIATPHLVKPMNMAKQSLPTDYYVEPNDFEFYLLGALQGKSKPESKVAAGSLDGDFGHSLPEEN